LRAQTKAS